MTKVQLRDEAKTRRMIREAFMTALYHLSQM